MTREEYIREASIDYQLSTNPRAISGDAFADMAREMNVNPSFIAGAKWADKTMVDKACDLYRDELIQFNNLISHLNPDYAGLVDVEKSYKDFKKALKGGGE